MEGQSADEQSGLVRTIVMVRAGILLPSTRMDDEALGVPFVPVVPVDWMVLFDDGTDARSDFVTICEVAFELCIATGRATGEAFRETFADPLEAEMPGGTRRPPSDFELVVSVDTTPP